MRRTRDLQGHRRLACRAQSSAKQQGRDSRRRSTGVGRGPRQVRDKRRCLPRRHPPVTQPASTSWRAPRLRSR